LISKILSRDSKSSRRRCSRGSCCDKSIWKKESKDPLASAKVFGTRDIFKQSAKENYNLDDLFILRAVGAQLGIYGNSGAEAIYPTYLVDAEGAPLDASKNNYTMTFKKGEFPPVKAFWSLTMYDGKTQLLIDNPLTDIFLILL
jgi:hypothetical protein